MSFFTLDRINKYIPIVHRDSNRPGMASIL